MGIIRRLSVCLILMCCLAIFGASKADAQTYTFGSASLAAPGLSSTSPPSGNQAIITADFNGDGVPDVVIAGTLPSSTLPSGTQVISIYLGKLDGTFAAAVNIPLQSGPATGLVAGDFNGDGKADLVVTGIPGTASTYILLGNGDGTFQTPVAIANSNYSAVATGDLNGDGKLDVILATPNSGSGSTLAVLLGNGDSTFQTPTTYSVSGGPYIVIGDFNGDGRPDLAAGASSTISVLINAGNGTFGTPINTTTTGNMQTLAAEDMNGDGKLDLVVPFGGASAGVAVLPGNGDGSFGTAIVYTSNLLSVFGASAAIDDFNGDGKFDLAVTNATGTPPGVVMLLGNGDGTFQAPAALYNGGLSPSAVVALDINGDAKPDLVVDGGSNFDEALTVLLNHGDGTFPALVSSPTAINPGTAVTGDFNGDGKSDIAVSSITESNGATGTPVSGAISVLLSNGDGTFKTHLDSVTPNFPFAIANGDFNGDGITDLVAIEDLPAGSQILATWLGNGDGTFTEMQGAQSLSGMNSIAVGDFNHDGKPDVAAVGINNSNVFIFLGNGDGTFTAPTEFAVGSMSTSPPNHNVLTGDLNEDGKLDLAVATDNGIAILLGNGDGSFQPPTLLTPIVSFAPQENLFALADFNGDGKLDILRCTPTNIIEVELGNGDGTFKAATGYQLIAILNVGAAVVGDFNGDGKPDVTFAGQSNAMTILFGNGDGTFGVEADYASLVNASLNFVASADFNGDGAPDVAMANQSDSNVSVYLSSSAAAFSPRSLAFASEGVGTTSQSQAVTLSNPSGTSLAISSISASSDFTVSNNCGATLGAGKSCQAEVAFSPTGTGTRTGLLSFADSAESTAQTLALTGPGTDFTIAAASGSSTSMAVTAGQTASYSLTLTPEGGFNGTASVTCTGAPSEATCIASPSSAMLNGTSSSAITVNVATTGRSLLPPSGNLSRKWPLVIVIAVALMLLTMRLKPRRNGCPARLDFHFARKLVLAAVLFGGGLMVGCGGGGSAGNNTGTPAGDYALTVTATSGSLTHSMTLHLTVQ